MRPLLVVPIVAALVLLQGLSASAQEVLRSVTVNGVGQVEVAPDMATMRLAVRIEAETTGEAMDQASRATADILAMLRQAEVEDADIQTGAVRLNPVYGQTLLSGQRQITGYTALNSVVVTVRDLDELGGLITAAVNEGANTLAGVEFGLQEPQAHEDDARRVAVADAARRAGLYAEAAGIDLGPLVSLHEQGTSGYRPMAMEPVVMEASISRAAFDVPVAAGEITLTASIVVVYALAGD